MVQFEEIAADTVKVWLHPEPPVLLILITAGSQSVHGHPPVLKVPVHQDELLKDNNTRSEPIVIRRESLKVLVVESFPRWEYRYLRNALERDPGVEVSCLLMHPGLSKVGGGRGYLQGD